MKIPANRIDNDLIVDEKHNIVFYTPLAFVLGASWATMTEEQKAENLNRMRSDIKAYENGQKDVPYGRNLNDRIVRSVASARLERNNVRQG